uniref:Uncharacterized protein n=2 Tax=Cacopsylla melanoneura TaxID=428564 RepID=A0A8D8RFY6_9HEMI
MIDLSDAYCHVPVKERHQRFLAFIQRGHLQLDMPTVRTGLGTASFCAANELGSSSITQLGSTSTSLLGRLSHSGSLSSPTTATRDSHTQLTPVPWVASERAKIPNRSIPDQNISRTRMEHENSTGLSPRGKGEEYWSFNQTDPFRRQMVSPLTSTASRHPEHRFICCSTRRLHLRPLELAGRRLPRNKNRAKRPIPLPGLMALD